MSAACPTYGFTIDVQFRLNVAEAGRRAVWASFARLIDQRALTASEPMKPRWQCIVQSEASQATDADRQAIRSWAGERDEIVGIAIGQLIDLSATE